MWAVALQTGQRAGEGVALPGCPSSTSPVRVGVGAGAAAGRLNVLANVVRKPMRQIFCEFSGVPSDVSAELAGQQRSSQAESKGR